MGRKFSNAGRPKEVARAVEYAGFSPAGVKPIESGSVRFEFNDGDYLEVGPGVTGIVIRAGGPNGNHQIVVEPMAGNEVWVGVGDSSHAGRPPVTGS